MSMVNISTPSGPVAGQSTHHAAVTPIRGELANLDTLRSFAVLAVLFDHLALTLNALYLHSQFLEHFVMRLGRLGVVAFFVHTSLVLMFSLERVHRETNRPALVFYLRRFFRIYPLSVLVVIFVCIFQIPDLPFSSNSAGRYAPLNIVANLLLVQNFYGITVTGPLWSLPFEVEMYVLLPALFLVARRPNSTSILMWIIAGFSVIGVTCYQLTGKLHFLGFIPCFLSGILAYTLRSRPTVRIPAFVWTLAVPALMLSCALVGAIWPRKEYLAGWALSFALGGSVYLFSDSTNRTWNGITKNIAKYSYGIYLLHVPTIWLVFKVLGITSPLPAVALVLLILSIASFTAFHTVENPMIQYGKGITKGLKGQIPRADRPQSVQPVAES